jgi:hypothetical protein
LHAAVKRCTHGPLGLLHPDHPSAADRNRISGKIENVAEVSKVPLKIQNNSGRSKTPIENSNRQPNVGRSVGDLKPQRQIEKFSGKIKFLAENLQRQRKIRIFGWSPNVSGEDLNFRTKI